MHRQLRQPELPPAHHDEGPVRQLRGPEDDRRCGDQPAEDLDAQDTASHFNTEKNLSKALCLARALLRFWAEYC